MKKLLIILIITTSFITYTSPVLALTYRNIVPFKDTKNHEFEHHITYLYKLGYIDGFSDQTFRPDNPVTRGEFSKFIKNVFLIPDNTSGDLFDDVQVNHPFFLHIESLKNKQIIDGYSDGLFRPDQSITKAEASKILFNASRHMDQKVIYESQECLYTDLQDSKFEGFICALLNFTDKYHENILDNTERRFYPDLSLTRGELARWVLNAGSYIPQTTEDLNKKFIEFPGWNNNFIRPYLVQNFGAHALSNAVSLKWTDFNNSGIDESIDGYILQRKNGANWENIDQATGLNATYQENLVTISGTVESGDIYKIYVNNDFEYAITSEALDTIESITENLARALGRDDAVDTYYQSRDPNEIKVISSISGVEFDLDPETLNGGVLNDQEIEEDIVTKNDEGNPIRYGIILEKTISLKTAQYTDLSARNDELYFYRIAAFKFIPRELALKDYNTQLELENDLSVTSNMIIGPWRETSIETLED